MQRAPLLVLSAYREAEADDNRALGRALAELNRLRLLEVLRVHPLELNDTARLAAGLLRGDVGPQLTDLLHRHAEGNPFFEEELLRALTDDGTLVETAGSWDISRTPQGLLPTGILEAIRLRLARLPEPVVDILRGAAVIGRSWSIPLLAPVADLDLERAEDLVLVAVRARLVRPQSDGGYAFVHDKVREALYEEVPVHRRRRLHQAIGEGLEREPVLESARRLAELTFHFVRASDVERGVAYALDAAEHALAASAPAEAVEHFRAAVDLLGRSADYDARRARALLGLGAAATLSGDYRLAEESYRTVARASLEAGQHTVAARAWHGLAGVRWRQEAVGDARAAFEQALAMLGPGDSTEAAETLLRLAELNAVSLGLADVGLAHGERALAMVERLHDRRLEAAVCFTMGSVRTWRCEPAEGRALLEQAQQVVDRLETPEPRAIARCKRGGIDYYRGRFRAAEGEFRAAFEEIRAVETGSVLWVLPWLPWALAELGRSDEALGLWAEVEQKLEPLDVVRLGIGDIYPSQLVGAQVKPVGTHVGGRQNAKPGPLAVD
jgi:tetratricopeptide (TPR) repeat protein